ncbi:hypothetical protein [Corallococcus sp. M7]
MHDNLSMPGHEDLDAAQHGGSPKVGALLHRRRPLHLERRGAHDGGDLATCPCVRQDAFVAPGHDGHDGRARLQAHDDELAAFRAYAHRIPETTLLVDMYDTLEGMRKVVALARELGPDFHVQAVRLDLRDLASLAHQIRALLDAAGLERVRILASGGLDEDAVARLLAHQAPIDAFGVGTAMGVSEDAPALDMAYKLNLRPLAPQGTPGAVQPLSALHNPS